jgi:hypothetical protein
MCFCPNLFGLAGKYRSTSGLLKEGSMAVWGRQLEQTSPQDWSGETPFELCVRSYGPDRSLAEVLVEWDAARQLTAWRLPIILV